MTTKESDYREVIKVGSRKSEVRGRIISDCVTKLAIGKTRLLTFTKKYSGYFILLLVSSLLSFRPNM